MGHEVIFKTAFFSVESVVLDHYTVINKNKYSKRPFENFDLKSCLRSLVFEGHFSFTSRAHFVRWKDK